MDLLGSLWLGIGTDPARIQLPRQTRCRRLSTEQALFRSIAAAAGPAEVAAFTEHISGALLPNESPAAHRRPAQTVAYCIA